MEEKLNKFIRNHLIRIESKVIVEYTRPIRRGILSACRLEVGAHIGHNTRQIRRVAGPGLRKTARSVKRPGGYWCVRVREC